MKRLPLLLVLIFSTQFSFQCFGQTVHPLLSEMQKTIEEINKLLKTNDFEVSYEEPQNGEEWQRYNNWSERAFKSKTCNSNKVLFSGGIHDLKYDDKDNYSYVQNIQDVTVMCKYQYVSKEDSDSEKHMYLHLRISKTLALPVTLIDSVKKEPQKDGYYPLTFISNDQEIRLLVLQREYQEIYQPALSDNDKGGWSLQKEDKPNKNYKTSIISMPIKSEADRDKLYMLWSTLIMQMKKLGVQ